MFCPVKRFTKTKFSSVHGVAAKKVAAMLAKNNSDFATRLGPVAYTLFTGKGYKVYSRICSDRSLMSRAAYCIRSDIFILV